LCFEAYLNPKFGVVTRAVESKKIKFDEAKILRSLQAVLKNASKFSS